MRDSKKRPLVSIVIPTYNRWDKLPSLLDSVLHSSYRNIEIIVIDDHSTDNTLQQVEARYGDRLRIYVNKANSGVAFSRNRGIKHASGNIIFLIDDDNILDKDCIDKIVQGFNDNPDASMVGPVMYYAKSPNSIWWAGTKRNMLSSKTTFVKEQELPNDMYWTTDDFPNAWAFKSEFKKYAHFDESFYIHYEESDFAYRLKSRTHTNFVVASGAKIYHDINSESKDDTARRWNNTKRVYYTARNRKIFHRRYSSPLQYALFIMIFNNLLTAYYLRFIWKIDMGPKRNNLANMLSYVAGSLSWNAK